MKRSNYITLCLLGLGIFGIGTGELVAQQEQIEAKQVEGKDNKDKDENVPLRNLARIQGVRSDQLLGYGLVVGLPGSGDTRSSFASAAIQNLLSGLGQKSESSRLTRSRNIAAVLVTAEAPSFIKSGTRLDATISSIGDARSLEGGVLIQTPLYAGDRKIYAVAQGALTTAKEEKKANNSIGDSKTVGTLLSGVMIEKEIPGSIFDPDAKDSRRLRVSLRNFNFSTLHAIYEKLKDTFPNANVQWEGGSLSLDVPNQTDPVAFIAKMEKIRIKPQRPARVVINERSGTIVMGGDVRVDPVSISRNGMEVRLSSPDATAANIGIELGQGAAVSAHSKTKTITRQFSGSNLNEIIEALNGMGAGVKDIIAILEALRQAGALHAELIVN